jgi:ABC-type dipeptide/oligopeptide/nickel transport system permease subunit
VRAILVGAPEIPRPAPWTIAFGGSAIFLAVLAVNLLGDGLRDAFDPTLGPKFTR